jgi:hypothetical protein
MRRSLAFTLLTLFCSAASLSAETARALTGSVAVEAVGERQIAIAIDTFNEGRRLDGLVDYLFVFRGKEPFAEWLSLLLPYANLEVSNGVLRLSSPAGERDLIFALHGRLPARFRPGRPGRDEGGSAPARPQAIFRGFELAEYGNLPRLLMADFTGDPAGGPHAVFLPFDYDYNDPFSGGGDCAAGGPGASSCSVGCNGGCSVSCSSGYACCSCSSPPSCRCVG